MMIAAAHCHALDYIDVVKAFSEILRSNVFCEAERAQRDGQMISVDLAAHAFHGVRKHRCLETSLPVYGVVADIEDNVSKFWSLEGCRASGRMAGTQSKGLC